MANPRYTEAMAQELHRRDNTSDPGWLATDDEWRKIYRDDAKCALTALVCTLREDPWVSAAISDAIETKLTVAEVVAIRDALADYLERGDG